MSAYRDDATGLEARLADARGAWEAAVPDALAKGREPFLEVAGRRAVCMFMVLFEVGFAALVVQSWVVATSRSSIGRGVGNDIHCGGLVIIGKMFLVPFIVLAAIVLYAIASRYVRHIAVRLGVRSLGRILATPTALDELERDTPAARLARFAQPIEISGYAWEMAAFAILIIDGLLYVGFFLPDGDEVFPGAVRSAGLMTLLLIECLLLLLPRRVSNLTTMLATVPFVVLASLTIGVFGMIAFGLFAAGLAHAVSARPR